MKPYRCNCLAVFHYFFLFLLVSDSVVFDRRAMVEGVWYVVCVSNVLGLWSRVYVSRASVRAINVAMLC